MSKNSKNVRHLSEASLKQITILKALYAGSKSVSATPVHSSTSVTTTTTAGSVSLTANSQYERDINEIAELSGLVDEKETQRYLYILEGHKLVTPKPAGDFTSKMWALTDDGVKTFKQISKDFSL